MSSTKVFIWLAAAAGFTGIGMLLAQAIGNSTDNTPFWIGGVLIVFGAVLLGMAISSREVIDKKIDTKNEKKTQ